MANPVDDGTSRARRAPAAPPDRTRAFVIASVLAVLFYWVWLFGLRSRLPTGPTTGVFVCDEYLAIMARCLVHMPVDGRPAHAELIRTTRENLTRAAAHPDEIPRLTRVCTEMRDAVRKNPVCR